MSLDIVIREPTTDLCPVCEDAIEAVVRVRRTSQAPEGINPELGLRCMSGQPHVDPAWRPLPEGEHLP